MSDLIGLQRYTLCRLEQVKSSLNPHLIAAADSIINKFDENGIINQYEFEVASDFVLLALSKMEERESEQRENTLPQGV